MIYEYEKFNEGCMISTMEVLEKIDHTRCALDWSWYRLAKEADIPYSSISNMIHRNTCPSILTLQKICFAFGITLGEFFSSSDQIYEKMMTRFTQHWPILELINRANCLSSHNSYNNTIDNNNEKNSCSYRNNADHI